MEIVLPEELRQRNGRCHGKTKGNGDFFVSDPTRFNSYSSGAVTYFINDAPAYAKFANALH